MGNILSPLINPLIEYCSKNNISGLWIVVLFMFIPFVIGILITKKVHKGSKILVIVAVVAAIISQIIMFI